MVGLVSHLSAAPTPKDKKPMSTIKIGINGFRSDEGQLLILIVDRQHSKNFPKSKDEAIQKARVKIHDRKASVEFKNIPYGEYAVSCFHDENSDEELDTVPVLGIPKEGIGTSNNVKPISGPPRFEEAMFPVNQKTKSIQIKMQYLL